MVPLAFENPRLFGLRLGIVSGTWRNSPSSLCRPIGRWPRKCSTIDEMNMRIVEAWDDQLPAEVNDFCGWASQLKNVC